MTPPSAPKRFFLRFTADAAASRGRLDVFLAACLAGHGVSREKVKRLISEGAVTLDGAPCRGPKTRPPRGGVIEVTLEEAASSLAPEEGDIRILYRDDELVVLDKPAGLTVHPAPGRPTGTLAHRLVAHFPELARQEGFRPGIVHRLDKDTSGLLLAALTEKSRLALSALFAGRAVRKEYLALARGVPPALRGDIDAPLGRHPRNKVKMAVIEGGREARSSWQTLYADPDGRFSLLAVRIHTGRTHQIRVHMAHLGLPLLGDALYGDETARALAPRQMLHAWKLAFPHPGEAEKHGTNAPHGGESMRFSCPPPDDFSETLANLSRRMVRCVVTGSPGCGKSTLSAALADLGVPVFSADDEVRSLYEAGGAVRGLLLARYGERFVPGGKGPVDKAPLGRAMAESPAFRREIESLVHPLIFRALEDFWQRNERLGHPLAAAEIPLYLETGGGTAGADDTRAGKRGPDSPDRPDTDKPGPESPDGPAAGKAEPIKPGGPGNADFPAPWRRTPPAALAGGSARAPVLAGVRCPFDLRRERLERHRGWSAETVARMESWQWPEEEKMRACDIVLDNAGTPEQLGEQARRLRALLLALPEARARAVLARARTLWQG